MNVANALSSRLGEHVEVQPVHPVPGAGAVHRGAGQQAPDDAQRLLQPADALARRVEPDPGGVVFGLVPACPEAKLEPSAGPASSCAPDGTDHARAQWFTPKPASPPPSGRAADDPARLPFSTRSSHGHQPACTAFLSAWVAVAAP